MIGLPGVSAATNAFNAQSLRFYNGKYFDPKFANDPKNAQNLNLATASMELANIRQLYCSRYKWKSDDENMPVDYIESMLFLNGMLAFFHDADFGWLLLPCAVKRLNVYGQPSEVSVMFPYAERSNRILKQDEFILLRDNPANNIPYYTVQYYTRLIADTARSCEVYAQGMKKPIMMIGDFNNASTRKQFINNVQMNESYIIIDSSTMKDIGEGLNLIQNSTHNAQDLKGLYMYKTDLYNECVARLGIVTPTVIKQAQVNKDEINKNDTMANIVLNGTFECRQEAVKAIYERSKINLTCELAPDLNEGVTEKVDPDNGV